MKRILPFFVLFFGMAARAEPVVNCGIGEYAQDGICAACPAGYPYSMQDADSINDCYLMTLPGKAVVAAGQLQTMCPENYYCPGAIPVFYDLKDRFRRIDYIKSTGAQYIDTGIVLGSDIDTDMVFENGSVHGDNWLFGANSADGYYSLNGYNNNAYIRYNDYHPIGEYKAAIPVGVRVILEIKHGNWILGGKTIYSNSGEFNSGRTGYLFAVHSSVVGAPHADLKVYSFIQWRNDEKVIELIPVYDSVRDECGMLDMVTGKFFGNVGTGKFECGSLVDEFVGANGAASCAVSTDNIAPYSPVGADDVSDCGRVLRFSDNYNLYLRTIPRTQHSLKVQFNNNIFYGDSTEEKCGHLRVQYQGQTLSVCNMDADLSGL